MFFEQMVAVAPKGTDLGLCDLISAMFSGYFIESGGTVTPAIDAFLCQEVKDEKEREARTRRGAKAKVPPIVKTKYLPKLSSFSSDRYEG